MSNRTSDICTSINYSSIVHEQVISWCMIFKSHSTVTRDWFNGGKALNLFISSNYIACDTELYAQFNPQRMPKIGMRQPAPNSRGKCFNTICNWSYNSNINIIKMVSLVTCMPHYSNRTNTLVDNANRRSLRQSQITKRNNAMRRTPNENRLAVLLQSAAQM